MTNASTHPAAVQKGPLCDGRGRDGAAWGVAWVVGCALTLTVRGYQFGESNHSVYLLAALRRSRPELLANDWWVNGTLQYHGLFAWVAGALYWTHPEVMRWGFLVGYAGLAAGLHLLWARLTWRLGGTWRTYLGSVGLYYVSAGGFGLGFYEVLQDSALLPSNVANLALLGAVVAWVEGKVALTGVALGVAGLFHLNHAVVALPLWGVFTLVSRRGERWGWEWVVGTAAMLVGCAVNVGPAVGTVLERQGGLELGEFVSLYVRVRHPHHYDPSSWPVGLWVAFLWTGPLAWMAWRRGGEGDVETGEAVRRCGHVIGAFGVMLGVAVLGAGVWYVSESLVQMSLYRFSIVPKLLMCVGAAGWIEKRVTGRVVGAVLGGGAAAVAFVALGGAGAEAREVVAGNGGVVGWFLVLMVFVAAPQGWVVGSGARGVACVAVVVVGTTGVLWQRGGDGVRVASLPRDEAEYRALCEWVSGEGNTPVEAVILVPPSEEGMRLHGRRAIVVNFKGVPQLSGELREWRERLEAVLGMDVTTLPRRYDLASKKIGEVYEGLSGEHLSKVAKRYGAGYVVTIGEREDVRGERVYASERYRLYRLWEAERP